MNQNSRQQVARITTQAGSYAGRPYAFQKAQTRGRGKKEEGKHILSALCALIALTTLHTKLRAIHPPEGCSPIQLPSALAGHLTPLRGHVPTVPLDQTRLCSTAQSGCGLTAARSRSRGADTRGRGSV